jgi:hypothetical protein
MHDIPGLYATHTDGLYIKGFEVHWPDEIAPFFNHGIHCEYFKNLMIDGFVGRQPQASGVGAAIALNDGEGVTIANCKADVGTDTFLKYARLRGELVFANNDTSNAEHIMYPTESDFQFRGPESQ